MQFVPFRALTGAMIAMVWGAPPSKRGRKRLNDDDPTLDPATLKNRLKKRKHDEVAAQRKAAAEVAARLGQPSPPPPPTGRPRKAGTLVNRPTPPIPPAFGNFALEFDGAMAAAALAAICRDAAAVADAEAAGPAEKAAAELPAENDETVERLLAAVADQAAAEKAAADETERAEAEPAEVEQAAAEKAAAEKAAAEAAAAAKAVAKQARLQAREARLHASTGNDGSQGFRTELAVALPKCNECAVCFVHVSCTMACCGGGVCKDCLSMWLSMSGDLEAGYGENAATLGLREKVVPHPKGVGSAPVIVRDGRPALVKVYTKTCQVCRTPTGSTQRAGLGR